MVTITEMNLSKVNYVDHHLELRKHSVIPEGLIATLSYLRRDCLLMPIQTAFADHFRSRFNAESNLRNGSKDGVDHLDVPLLVLL